jgi:hypothetical protein
LGVTACALAGAVHLLGGAIDPSEGSLATPQGAAVALGGAAIRETAGDLLALPGIEQRAQAVHDHALVGVVSLVQDIGKLDAELT